MNPVAGIAMGLLLDTQTKKFVVLSDILGGLCELSITSNGV